MCGIAGVYAYRAGAPPVDRDDLERVRDAMAARGPDAAGTWLTPDGRLGLAHRRLSIIDPVAASDQPLWDATGRYGIVFNGEIYNFRELRRELEARGRRFATAGDTEVLVNLYAEYGPAMFPRLRGMFALAIWDTQERSLLLARDALGIKPLYLADDGATLRFASQVQALRRSRQLTLTPSPAGHAGFLVWGHVPDPYTLYAEIRAVPAGTTVVFRPDAAPATTRWFTLTGVLEAAEAADAGRELPPDEVLATLRAAVRDSVRAHLVADVPVGVFLSAGLDSTIIAREVAAVGAELRTVTLGFEEYRGTAEDETVLAERTARLLGARHQTLWVSRRDFEDECRTILAAMDQPSCDGINTYFVSRAARAAGLKVALSGVGGDELFASYPSFQQVPRLAATLGRVPGVGVLGRLFRPLLTPVARLGFPPKLTGLLEHGGTLTGAYLLRRGLYLPAEVDRILDPEFAAAGLRDLATGDALRATVGRLGTDRFRVSALEMSWYMRGQLLRDTDWASMAHSLEVRTPFVDRVLLETAAPLLAGRDPPPKKALLEAGDEPHFRALANKPKTGFAVPVTQWLTAGATAHRDEYGPRSWSRTVFDAHRANRAVLALLTDGYGGRGGIAKFNRDLLDSVAAADTVEHIEGVMRHVVEKPVDVPAKVAWRTGARRGKLAFVAGALRAALSRDLDYVVCGHINFLPLALAIAGWRQARLLLVVHGIDVWAPPPGFQRHGLVNLLRRLLARVDDVIAVSQVTANRLMAWSAIAAGRFHILPNCVDPTLFSPDLDTRGLAARYDVAGCRVLLTVGRLAGAERYKGFDEVLEVLPSLRQEYTDLRYIIGGDGEDRNRLEARARELGVADIVRFAGYVPEADKAALYTLADAYVMPSRGEGFGIVFLEALASGVPAVGSRIDGSREALLGGRLGALVDPDNREELAAAIRAALARPKGVPAELATFYKDAFTGRVHAILATIATDLPRRPQPAPPGGS
jgi:asparagine synthase (glutamine-hydrolysing)